MTISKLGTTNPALAQDRAITHGNKAKSGSAAPATSSASADVKLSPLSEKLKALAREGSADATFDEKKVNDIKASIANGTFKVNAETVADKMIAEAKDLAGKKA
jgi:negative regulator of flagellin synthesis FlgM